MKKPEIRIVKNEILSDDWYVLRKVTFDYQRQDGSWQQQSREVYEQGDGATILLYNREAGTIVLTRQFRMPTFLNGNETGLFLETPAGMLDRDNPEEGVRRETEEETGYQVRDVRKVFELFMSVGSTSEILHFFVAEYTPQDRKDEGGGTDEDEDIEVLEVPFTDVLRQVEKGEIRDAKTILLLQYAQINQLLG